MKQIYVAIFALSLSACAPVVPAPITKANYSGRDFAKENPNEGFPVVVCEQCGDGNGASGGPGL